MTPISGIITTLNEEKNLEAAIRSLQQVCNEVVIVDSLSNDRTVEIAKQCGATIVMQPYLGDGIQKNVGVDNARNNWVLSMDADERLTPELVDFIRNNDLEKMKYDGYALRRRNYVGSRWIKCCHWYPDYLVRLFRKDRLHFQPIKQHSFVPTKNTLKIKADLIHYRYKHSGELFGKPGRNYSSRGAKLVYLSGRKVNAFTPVLHGAGAFLVNYFLRGGIFGGIDGLTLSLAIAQNSYLKYAKVLEWRRDPKVRDAEDFDNVW